ncbi:MAG: hypothetical protein FP823_06960 [Rhodoferax sp.]|nr:hypothetical protein [Rhodoferax sp.]
MAPAPVQAKTVTSTKAPVKAARKPATKRPATPVKTSVKPAVRAAVKVAVKPLVKATPIKTVAKAVRQPAPPPSTDKTDKTNKDKKPKLVRDSFTIPKAEYTVLDELKQRTGKLLSTAKKSELIRAGIKALAAMSDAALLAALKAVPAIKTGRPKK